MAFNLTTADAILKDDYMPPVRETLNSATVLLKQLKRNTTDWEGRQAYIPIHKSRNVGVGARLEGGTLPLAGNQGYDKYLYKAKYLYGSIEITGPAIASTKNNGGAFLSAVDSEMKGITADLKVDQNRQMWHDGSSVLTQVNDTATTAAITVRSTKFIKAGQPIQIFTANGATERVTAVSGDLTVASVQSATAFTLSGTTTAPRTATDVVILLKTRDNANWGLHQETWGLEGIVSNADPGNNLTDLIGGASGATVTRTNNKQLQANTVTNNADGVTISAANVVRALTLDLMQTTVDLTDIESDIVPGLILTSHALKRRYASLLVADKRYPSGGEITLDGGYKALEFNGISLVADKDSSVALGYANTASAPNFGRMYFLAMSSLELGVLEDWDWLQTDGHVLKMKPGTSAYADSWQAYMAWYGELFLNRANANAVLCDIDENP